MATDQLTEAMDKLSIDDDDFEPTREPLYTNPDLAKWNLSRITSTIPLEIRSSGISMGSGLFATVAINVGHEIYRSVPMMTAISPGNESFCHHCLKNTADTFSGEAKRLAQACGRCRVARFCNKKCQKTAWALNHRDECKILKEAPDMPARTLMVFRFIYWQQRGFVTTKHAQTMRCLESHFHNYNNDPKRATKLLDSALGIRDMVGGKMDVTVPWKLLATMETNCVRLRPAFQTTEIGYAYDVVTAMINHSCDPNAFVFFEGNQLRIRSLKNIAAGEEITICYVDPTHSISVRKLYLEQAFFFDCHCNRCKMELKERRSLVGSSKKLADLDLAEKEIAIVGSRATRASRYPGVYTEYEDLPTVETKLRTITANALPAGKTWPDDMDPLPAFRASLAMLYMKQGKFVPGLRNALLGMLSSSMETGGPELVNTMLDVLTMLIAVGSLPPDAPAFEDKTFPSLTDIRTMTYGCFYGVALAANAAFGKDSEYAQSICDMNGAMMRKKVGTQPGSEDFAEEFKTAQRKLFAWAGVDADKSIGLE